MGLLLGSFVYFVLVGIGVLFFLFVLVVGGLCYFYCWGFGYVGHFLLLDCLVLMVFGFDG